MEQITNEQLVAKIQAGENTAENMLQLWQQTKAYIYKLHCISFSKISD